MCGICGIINFHQQPVQEVTVRNMMKIQKHRGPDDEGVFLENNIGLGFVRLSILDLSPAGHQPMFSHDERYVIVFNGEIYNYLELRDELRTSGYRFKSNTDTEVLLAAYQHWGEECLDHLNGMWAFVIYDREKKSLFASRDRYGIKPFYYYATDELFAFASEIKPLLILISEKPKPDNQSIFDYLVFNRTDHTQRTFFENVKKLQHGYNVIIESNRIYKKRWYTLREKVDQEEGFKSSDEFRDLFSSAIGLRLRSDVPVGVCLSGGLDSSSIVSLLLKNYKKKDLNTFSAVYNKGQFGDETEFIDEYSSLLNNMFFTIPSANSLEVDHIEFIKAHAEPVPSTSPYAQFKVMDLAKDHVVVTLDGQGADELLAGYHYFYGYLFKDLLRKVKPIKLLTEIYHYLNKHHSIYGLKTFFYLLLPGALRASVRVSEKGYLDECFSREYSSNNAISGNLYGSSTLKNALLDHFEYKLEHLLKWEDRNSMWFSLESRVPFLDYRVVEKTLATDSDIILNKGVTKHILREAMSGTVPEKIRLRKDKMGFGTPESEWFKTQQWQKIINTILESNSFRQRGIIVANIAQKKYHHHLNGKINISKEIWKWLNLEIWFREFID